MTKYYGKYRGTVVSNIDPEQRGRIQVSVPAVFGDNRMSWAMPCTPYGGSQVGWFAVPPVSANVWVEFEEGEPDYPIWSGCFWGSGEAPAMPVAGELKVIKTDTVTITINDTPGAGGVKIETTIGMKIEIGAVGIEINNGQGASIKLQGPRVSINDSALEVV
jgi:uncharacterized protein involved in type VI secretion and phage assembly